MSGPKRNPDKLNTIIAKLDHDDFKVRDDAANELVRLGASVSSDLQAALKRAGDVGQGVEANSCRTAGQRVS